MPEILDNKGPYTIHTDEDRQRILNVIGGYTSVDEFVDELLVGVPKHLRRPQLDLPAPISELELKEEMAGIAAENVSLDGRISFLGSGVARNFIPAIVGAMMGNQKFYTVYTPYRPEVSQGTLQYTYELQQMLKKLYKMGLAGAGVYSGDTAAAEAMRATFRITGRRAVGIVDSVDPNMQEVVATYAFGEDAQVRKLSNPEQIDDDLACVLVQQPTFHGDIEDIERWERAVHAKGGLMVVSEDPIFAGMFAPAGDFNADFVVGEGQPLGITPRFGGSYYGIFTCRAEYVRNLPGRIYAETVDDQNRRGYVMVLGTREQYAAREKATSNLTTAVAYNALAVAITLAALGEYGVRHMGKLSYERAHYLAELISEIPGFGVLNRGDFFRQFVMRSPIPISELNSRLLERGIIGGFDVSEQVGENAALISVTEMNPSRHLDELVEHLKGVSK